MSRWHVVHRLSDLMWWLKQDAGERKPVLLWVEEHGTLAERLPGFEKLPAVYCIHTYIIR